MGMLKAYHSDLSEFFERKAKRMSSSTMEKKNRDWVVAHWVRRT